MSDGRGKNGRGSLRVLGVVGVAAIAAAACGSSDPSTPSKTPQKGGTLRVLYQGDVDSIDPGRTYYSAGYIITNVTQRGLTSYRPGAPNRAAPDLASRPPVV